MRTVILNIIGLCFAVAAVVLSANAMDGNVLAFFLACTFVVAGNSDRLKTFKAGKDGIEAETREAVAEAKHAVEEIRSLGTAVAKAMIPMMEADGRMGGGLSDARKLELKRSVLENLSELGVP